MASRSLLSHSSSSPLFLFLAKLLPRQTPLFHLFFPSFIPPTLQLANFPFTPVPSLFLSVLFFPIFHLFFPLSSFAFDWELVMASKLNPNVLYVAEHGESLGSPQADSENTHIVSTAQSMFTADLKYGICENSTVQFTLLKKCMLIAQRKPCRIRKRILHA